MVHKLRTGDLHMTPKKVCVSVVSSYSIIAIEKCNIFFFNNFLVKNKLIINFSQISS